MPNDPYYKSDAWRALRLACLKRDRFRCVVPGCPLMATHADHIVSRRNGGPDTLSNLRSLCRDHDQQIMQGPSGNRRSGGRLTLKGCDAHGMPNFRRFTR